MNRWAPHLPRAAWMVPAALGALTAGWLATDWYVGLPLDRTAVYVGRSTCAECHREQAAQFHGSHHDLAMAEATPETVLGDFSGTVIEHHGQQSSMRREGRRFLIQTEGPEGTPRDFEVEYVFGVTPLQQYLVAIDRDASDRPATASGESTDSASTTKSTSSTPTGSAELGRLQIPRVSWDAVDKRWFHLDPPDVHERLTTDDPLHWTRIGQNWNHMCSECHSTNVNKNFHFSDRQYRTTFSEIDVSCEACHGPGSLHVELARARSPFWDRRLGYGLARLKSPDASVEIEACAGCHSRRTTIAPGHQPSHDYHDHFMVSLLEPGLYYPDGQIRDEVYEYGSFLQSKMHAKGVRCTDCHDPHTARLKHTGNQVCVSCHQHPPTKYDTTTHHHHPPGSTGAQCVSCHMPDRPYMDLDFRRDHSFRVPRPDLSVELKTPNACTQCHLPWTELTDARRAELPHYAAWLSARDDDNDSTIDELLTKTDRWAAEQVAQWYPASKADVPPPFAHAMAAAWQRAPDAVGALRRVLRDLRYPPFVRASALQHLARIDPEGAVSPVLNALGDHDVLMRGTAASVAGILPPRDVYRNVVPLLTDPVRWVRIEAVRATAATAGLNEIDRMARERAFADLKGMWDYHADLVGTHVDRGVYYESAGDAAAAAAAYLDGIQLDPLLAGPRSNLAALRERQGQVDEAARLRREEFPLLERDARLAPDLAEVQYRYALALYLNNQAERSAEVLEHCVRLAPRHPDYWLALQLIYEHLQRPDDARRAARTLQQLSKH